MVYNMSIADWQKLLQQQTVKKITVNISETELTRTVTSKENSIMTLNFKDAESIVDFTYTRDGKNLLITNVIDEQTTQVITLKNYFSNSTGTATKSNIKYITYKNNPSPISIIDAGLVSTDYDFKPNKSGVVTGSVFSDTIDVYDKVTKAYDKKNKGATINAGKGNDDITGSKFNDVITGGAGYNKIRLDYTDGFGVDTIKLTRGEIVSIILTDGDTIVNKASLTYTKSGNNLVITRDADTENKIVVKDYFKNLDTAGVSINPTGNESSNIYDYLTAYTGKLNISGSKKIAGTIFGDNITGSAKADTITASNGNDIIDAKTNNDTIKLGKGNKQLAIALNDGNDTVTLSGTASLIFNFADDVDIDKVVFAKGTNEKDLYVYRENNQYTLVKNFFNTETILKYNNGVTVTVDRDDITAIAGNINANNTISDTNENDIIYGGNKKDKITVTEGDDSITLFKGNDTVTFEEDYEDRAYISTSGGTDNLIFKGQSADAIKVTREDEDVSVSVTDEAQNVSILATVEGYKDIVSTVNIKDKNNKVVATLKSGSGKLTGTAGRDIIVGSTKDDTITAGKGNDEIYTRGGNDKVVLTGQHGIDTIDSTGSDKVTLKLSALDMSGFVKDASDLVVNNDGEGYVYKNFFSNPDETADLWLSDGKNSVHVLNKSEDVDNTDNTKNNFVYLTGNDPLSYKGAKSTKTANMIYALDNASSFEHNGGNEGYYATGEYNNSYSANITQNSRLSISDEGGDDTLLLNNDIKELSLYFDVDRTDNIGYSESDLMFIKSSNMTYKNAKNIEKATIKGAVNIESFFKTGKVETVSYKTGETTTEIDVDGWALYTADKVATWLKINGKNSTEEVMMKGSDKQKKSLLNVYKNSTYEEYLEFKSGLNTFDELTFVMNGTNLDVKVADEVTESVADYFTTATEPLGFWYLDEENNLHKGLVGFDAPIQVSSKEYLTIGSLYNKVEFTGDYAQTQVEIEGGAQPVFVFSDVEYKDFYTKDDGTGHYTAGDPLIYKGGTPDGSASEGDWKHGGDNIKIANQTGDAPDFTVNDITIIDGTFKTSEIMIVDKGGLTKTIVIGGGMVDEENGEGGLNGTFESEILIGTDTSDTINAMGGDDLIYSGAGDDVLNFVKAESGQTPTGKNTAPMVVIGGSDYMPAHSYDMISVYDSAGSDTYNTSFDVGTYIEDIKKDENDVDTLNINDDSVSSVEDIRYMIDVYNHKYINASSKPVLYEDLYIMDKANYTTMKGSLVSAIAAAVMSGKPISMKGIMESVQGTFGYVWIDDQYNQHDPSQNATQQIENINLNGTKLDYKIDYEQLTPAEGDTYVQSLYQTVSAWLSEKNYDSAWDVVENDNSFMKSDSRQLLNFYGMSQTELQTYYNEHYAG